MIRNCVAVQHALPWGAVLKNNFIRINHNLHDFSVIHSHLKLNFIDAWREPSLWVVHCQWTSRAGGREVQSRASFLLSFCLERKWINDRKILLGIWHSASRVWIFKRTAWEEIINIHHQVVTAQNLHSTSMRSDQFQEIITNKDATCRNSTEWGIEHVNLIFLDLSS